MKKNKRDVFFDVAKGFGIVSIVLGHCWPLCMRFVYTYHLFLFFFVTGFFYNKEKYSKDPIGNIINKLKNNYSKYFFYSLIILLLHNIFSVIGIIQTENYSVSQIIGKTINLTMMFPSELLASAMWFVPVMIYAIALFGFLVYISSKIKKEFLSIMFLGIMSILLGVLGLYINNNSISLLMHVETSFLIMPIIFLAHFLRILYDKKIDFRNYLNWYGFIISSGLILIIIKKLFPENIIDLKAHELFDSKLFFIIVILGLYVSLYIAKVITKIKYLSTHIAFLGKYSFEIMAFHLVFFKLVDYFYGKINENITVSNFPVSDNRIWPIYFIVGVYGSIITYLLTVKIKNIIIIKYKKNLESK